MNSTNTIPKAPMPEEVGGMSISSLLQRAQHTPVGKQTKRWHDLEGELVRLHNRRNQVAGDKVMASVIDDRISDSEMVANQIAKEIANMPARNAIDVICKLAISNRLKCGIEDAEVQLSSSALLDLIRFVAASRKTED